jgi:hypothetical protein
MSGYEENGAICVRIAPRLCRVARQYRKLFFRAVNCRAACVSFEWVHAPRTGNRVMPDMSSLPRASFGRDDRLAPGHWDDGLKVAGNRFFGG